jgi:hypothetical protein
MCDPVTGAIAVGTVLKAGGSIMKGNAAAKAANRSADSVIADSRFEAKKIRELARQNRSEADAAFSASGVDVSQGTPELIQREIARKSEMDALNTILGGERQAKALRKSGQAAKTAGYLGAASSALGGYSDYAGMKGGWKK